MSQFTQGELTAKAGASLTAKKNHFAKITGAEAEGLTATFAAAATDVIIGIFQTNAADNAEVVVRLPGAGTSKLKLGSGGATLNDLLTADSAGKGVATTTEDDVVGAIALEDGDEDDVIEVLQVFHVIPPAS
jgi:hypothetical protein